MILKVLKNGQLLNENQKKKKKQKYVSVTKINRSILSHYFFSELQNIHHSLVE